MRSTLATALLAFAAVAIPGGCAVTHHDQGGSARHDVGDVGAVLDDFHQAAGEADSARYFAHFAPDGVFIGTDATERWTVEEFRAYAEPYFSKGQGWSYSPLERHVEFSRDETVAWFDERLWNESYGEVRGSGVLRRIGGRWSISQYVLSFPVPNDVAKEVVRVIRDDLESAPP